MKALGTYKGVFEHMRVGGHQGTSGESECMQGIQTYWWC